MSYILYNAMIALFLQHYSDAYSIFLTNKTIPVREIVSILFCSTFTWLSLRKQPVSSTLFCIPFFYLAGATDYRCGEIPDMSWLGILFLSFLYREWNWTWALLVFVCLLVFAHFNWLGFGDVKLISAWTLFCGWHILQTLFLASILALLVRVITKKENETIHFAPYLCLSFCLDLLFFL